MTARRKPLPVSELLRLACVYAEANEREHLRCIADTGDEDEIAKTRAFIWQIRDYRLRRWGKTRLEAVMDEMKPVPFTEIAKRPNSAFGEQEEQK